MAAPTPKAAMADSASTSPGPATRARRDDLRRLGGLALAFLAILAYDAVGRRFYRGYVIPQGYGMDHLLPEELAQITLFVSFGGLAVLGLVAALAGSAPAETMVGLFRKAADRVGLLAAAAAAWLFLASWCVGGFVLGHAAISDDEHVYRFIAQTLRTGSLTAPSPGGDLAFFQEQFVVLTDAVRYGKYPIGHPLLLALGQAVGAEGLVAPTVTALIALAVLRLGLTLFGAEATALALLLMATSPQVILTGATLLSQPTAALCLAAGLAALFVGGPRRTWWRALSGALFGYGMLVRPLPGVLFVAVAVAYLLRDRPRERASVGGRAAALASFLAPVALCAAAFLIVNRVQAGAALTTGYQAFHRTGEGAPGLLNAMGGDLAIRAMSVVSALLRLDVWMLGWPVSLLFCLFAASSPRVRVLWGMVAAEGVYRLASPKAGIGGVGPLYLYEVVPLLLLLSGAGLVRLARDGWRLPWRLVRPSGLAAIVLSGVVVSATMFLPPRLADLRRGAEAQLLLPRLLRARGITNAVVFHDGVVPPWTGLSWAYFPPCNSPRLDDDVLYLRLWNQPRAGDELWRRRFPQRSAWWFGYADGRPALVDFASYAASPPASPALTEPAQR